MDEIANIFKGAEAFLGGILTSTSLLILVYEDQHDHRIREANIARLPGNRGTRPLALHNTREPTGDVLIKHPSSRPARDHFLTFPAVVRDLLSTFLRRS